MLCQAISVTWMIVSGTFSSKLPLSMFILLKSTLIIPISSLENVKLSQSSLEDWSSMTLSSLENTVSLSF